MTAKEPLVPPRPIPAGFGWIDHRFLRDGHIRLRNNVFTKSKCLPLLRPPSRGKTPLRHPSWLLPHPKPVKQCGFHLSAVIADMTKWGTGLLHT